MSAHAQDRPAFDFRMVFYGPATDSAYAAEHRIRQVIKTRDRISLRVSPRDPEVQFQSTTRSPYFWSVEASP
jgi:hypothetical protein